MSGTAKYFLSAAVAGLIASLFALRMGEVFVSLTLPFLFPPVWFLPVGWTAALVLLASGSGAADGKKVMTAFYVSLGLIICWALLFFRLEAHIAAAVTGLFLTGIWLHLRQMIGGNLPQTKKRLLPCCIWAGYTAYLNVGICFIN
jgi:tryptophan-rich sensory protein